MKSYKKAFTLAEVLIVLGVIGVVSALTIPNLKDNTSDQVNVARAKKVYSELETAYDRTILKYGNQYNWTTTGANNAVTSAKDNSVVLYNRIKNYLDVKKDCGLNDTNGICWASSSIPATNLYTLLLSDGSSIAFDNNTESNTVTNTTDAGKLILIDVDGPDSGSGKEGYDIFKVFVNQDVLESKISSFVPNISDSNVGNMVSNQTPTPNEYMQWVLENGNMDYNKPTNECDNNTVKWHTLETCN